MKVILVLFLLFINASSFSQDKLLEILPVKDGAVTYTEVVQTDSLNKETLYLRAKKWFVGTYKSANDVIQLDDKEGGEITGKGIFKIDYYTRNPSISHTVTISVKNGRYRYVVTGFSYADNQSQSFNVENFPKSWAGKKKLYNNINEEVIRLIASLKKQMSASNKEDWHQLNAASTI